MKNKKEEYKNGDVIIWYSKIGPERVTATVLYVDGNKVWCDNWSDSSDKQKRIYVTLGESNFRKLTKLDRSLM